MNQSPRKLSVVIPFYNEGFHIRDTLVIIAQELDSLPYAYELILIDDGSKDETWGEILAFRKENPNALALRLSRRFGKELALCAGLEHCRNDAVIVMDGDLQHPPSLIPKMVKYWAEEGFDVVEAVKSNRGKESKVAKLRAKLFYSLFHRIANINLEGASDYKLLDQKVLKAWMQMSERNVFFRGMSAWLGFKRKEIPFVVENRTLGGTRWSSLSLLKLAVGSITSFSSLPIHIITIFGVIFLFFSVLLSLHTLFLKLTGVAFTGFTTVIILQLLIGSMLITALGIIGEYISKIYDEVKARPRYVIAEVLEAHEE